jgi:hypothetical protein
MDSQQFAGLGLSVTSFFARYAVPQMSPRIAWFGVMIGVLIMAANLSPSISGYNHLSFILFAAGCLLIVASIIVDRASVRPIEVPERHLSDIQVNKLVNEATKLKPVVSDIFVAHVNGDRESETFAHEFADAFRRSGILPIYGWTNAPDGPDQVGVIIAVRDSSAVPYEATRLFDALRAVGIEGTIQPFPKSGLEPRDQVKNFAIYIAPRPL